MTAVMDSRLDEPETLLGSTTPRLYTRPLVTGPAGPCGCGCPLTPSSSLGFEAVAFATDVLGIDLLPWQRFWLIHALELKAGTRAFRFSTVLTLVARQNGKTTLLKVVSLWFLYMGHGQLVLGAAQALNIARESWQGAVQLAESVPDLAAEIEAVRHANGEQCLTLKGYLRYMITAATRGAGRGLAVDLLILDELREQRSTEAWAALGNTTMARPNSLTVGISNQGDDDSIVLNTLRSAALADADPALGLFEYSAPDGCALDDRRGLAQANPGLGRTITFAKLATMRATTSAADYRTENLCQRVDKLDAAIDPEAWRDTGDAGMSLAPYRDRLAYCLEVTMDGAHVVLAAAARLDDGHVLGAVLDSWDSVDAARDALGPAFAKHAPRAVGWFPGGPAESIGVELREQHGNTIGKWDATKTELLDHSPGVVELAGRDVIAACQGFVSLVEGRRFTHPDDPLLNAHVAAAQRKDMGDGFRFARRGVGRVSALYAMAGAVELARRLPIPRKRVRSRIF